MNFATPIHTPVLLDVSSAHATKKNVKSATRDPSALACAGDNQAMKKAMDRAPIGAGTAGPDRPGPGWCATAGQGSMAHVDVPASARHRRLVVDDHRL
jgi:hypothetical protein